MASLPYVQQLLKVIVAQITQTIGWNSIQTTPLELLSDILHKYIEELTRQTQRYAELYGRTEPNLDDVALAFHDLNINISDLEEYIVNVDSIPCVVNVPKFPLAKDSKLNFLKPGSREVVTRPVHIHEHLPPIHPQDEVEPQKVIETVKTESNNSNYIQTYITTNQISMKSSLENGNIFDTNQQIEEVDAINVDYTAVVENSTIEFDDGNTFKKPYDTTQSKVTSNLNAEMSTSSNNLNSSGRPTRELISCIMTTSGFISPAREGKLPDAKRPIIIREDPPTPPPKPLPISPPPEQLEKKQITVRSNATDGPPAEPISDEPSNMNTPNMSNVEKLDEHISKTPKLFKVVPPNSAEPEMKIKKKLKHPQSDAKLKELKKAKKMQMLNPNLIGVKKKKQLQKSLNKLLIKPLRRKQQLLLETQALEDSPVPNMDMGLRQLSSEGLTSLEQADYLSMLTKKLKNPQSLKRKHKKKMLMKAASLPIQETIDGIDQPVKQRKKRIPKVSKKDLIAAGQYSDKMPNFANPIDSMNMLSGQDIHSMLPGPAPGATVPNLTRPPEKERHQMEHMKFDKLSNEPDKRKLNIFKKITSTIMNFDSSSSINRKTNKNIPENIPYQHMPPTKDTIDPPILDLRTADNLSMHNPFDSNKHYPSTLFSNPDMLTSTPNAMQDLPMGKKSKLKGLTKPPKIPKIQKEKKIKKETSPKKQKQPKPPKMMMDLPTGVPTPKMPFFPNMSFFDQFPAPGLIPHNPLFQSMPFGLPGSDPFVALPGIDLLNFARFKRSNFNEPTMDEPLNDNNGNRQPQTSTEHYESVAKAIRPLSNVAPFVPPSLLELEEFSTSLKQTDKKYAEQLTSNQQIDFNPPSKHHHQSTKKQSVTFENIDLEEKYGEKHFSGEQDIGKFYESEQKTTIVIDSDDEEKFTPTENWQTDYAVSTAAAPQLDRDMGQPQDEIKKKEKKIKDKNSSGHNKKDKKDKDSSGIKMKKKKDKKDKSKSKSIKHAGREGEHSKGFKDKATLKKEKREKKKEKDRLAAEAEANLFNTSPSKKHLTQELLHDTFAKEQLPFMKTVTDPTESNEFIADLSNPEINAIPKLTLKLAPSSSSPSSRPSTPDFPASQKKSSKLWKKKKQWRMEEESDKSLSDTEDLNMTAGSASDKNISSYQPKREPSPELARISALITRPPKQKLSHKQQSPIARTAGEYVDQTDSNPTPTSIRADHQTSASLASPTTIMPTTSSGRGRPKGSTSSSSKLGKTKTSKVTTFNLTGSVSNLSDSIVQPMDAQPSVTSRQQPSLLQSLDQQVCEENQVWICPACGRVDDGTPMIGCDGCDAWYHWVCVGIQVPPDQDQDWYCRVCISKKQEIDKKKKRKKKDKKEH